MKKKTLSALLSIIIIASTLNINIISSAQEVEFNIEEEIFDIIQEPEDTPEIQNIEENPVEDLTKNSDDEENVFQHQEINVSETEEEELIETEIETQDKYLKNEIDEYTISVSAKDEINVDIKAVSEERKLIIKDKIVRLTDFGYYIEDFTVFNIESKDSTSKNELSISISPSNDIKSIINKNTSKIEIYKVSELDALEREESTNSEDSVEFTGTESTEYAIAIISEYIETEEENPTGYIHLEDNIYNPQIQKLVSDSIDRVDIASESLSVLPASYVTPNLPALRNQNPYGTCWAHAALATAEINQMKQGKPEPDYSELQLAYSTYNKTTDPLGGTALDVPSFGTKVDYLNTGGVFDFAVNTLSTWEGISNESDAPYSTASKVYANGLGYDTYKEADMHLKDAYIVGIKTNSTQAKELIYTYGALGVTYYSQSGYSAEAGKAYNELYNCYYQDTAKAENHAVTVVGWDDNFPKENFSTTPEGDGAWLIRNSWGTYSKNSPGYYSYAGYFWMSYYDKTLSNNAYCLIMDEANNYDHNYQYDGSLYSYNIWNQRVANVFHVPDTAGKNQALKAIGVNLGSANKSFTIYIYKDIENYDATEKKGYPTAGTLAYTQNVATTYAGYHTIPLNQEVLLEPGENYSVVIVSDQGTSVLREGGVTMTGVGTTRVGAEDGQSFYYLGGTWRVQSGANFRIKAFTDDIENTPGTVVPTDITFKDNTVLSGKNILDNESINVGINIIPSNTTYKDVIWRSNNLNVATVEKQADGSGLIKGIGAGSATITVQMSKYSNISNSFLINVKSRADEISSFNIISPPKTRFNIGDKVLLSAIVNPTKYQSEIKWKSNSTNIATVTNSGEVTFLDAGKVIITAELFGKTEEIEFIVDIDPIENIRGYIAENNHIKIDWEYSDKRRLDSYYIIENPNGEKTEKLYTAGSTVLKRYLDGVLYFSYTDTEDYSSKLNGNTVTYKVTAYRNW